MTAYFIYGTFIAGFFGKQVGFKIMPNLLIQPGFWGGWLYQVGTSIGPYFAGAALLGALLLSKGLARAFLIGLLSDFVFGLVFTLHIHTHSYYSLPLVPLVALSIAPIVELVGAHVSQAATQWYERVAVFGVLLVSGLMILGVAFDRGQYKDPNAMDLTARVRMYEAIGDIVNHSPNTLISAPDYGSPLKYHGWIAGEVWPAYSEIVEDQKLFGLPELNMEERLNDLKAKSRYPPDYFIIVRDLNLGRFEDQKDSTHF